MAGDVMEWSNNDGALKRDNGKGGKARNYTWPLSRPIRATIITHLLPLHAERLKAGVEEKNTQGENSSTRTPIIVPSPSVNTRPQIHIRNHQNATNVNGKNATNVDGKMPKLEKENSTKRHQYTSRRTTTKRLSERDQAITNHATPVYNKTPTAQGGNQQKATNTVPVYSRNREKNDKTKKLGGSWSVTDIPRNAFVSK